VSCVLGFNEQGICNMELNSESFNSNGQELVDRYMPFVCSIAKQIKKSLSSKVEIDDLVSYGMTGLFEAAERFNPALGANFTTFSYYRIRGAIYDGLRKMGWVSRHEYQKIKFGEKATAYLESVAARDLVSVGKQKKPQEEIEELANQVSQLVTIFVTSLDGLNDVDFEDKQSTRQDELLEKHQLVELVRKALKKLPKEDLELIQLYYFKELSLEDVGKTIGLSKSWTCRRHIQVIEKLSALLKSELR